jgi:phosphoserine phosphatase
MIKILFSDLDGTLVEEESSWRLVHKFLGTDYLASKALQRFSRGEISYEEFVEHDVSLWPKGLKRSFFQYLFSKVRIRQDAKNLFKQLKNLGIRRVIVTSGLNVLAERVCRELEADECVSNEMAFDEKDCFTGTVRIRVDPSRKAEVLERICGRYSVSLSETAAIGDSVYDRSMFQVVGLPILYAKRGVLRETYGATHAVNNLEEAIGLLINFDWKKEKVNSIS